MAAKNDITGDSIKTKTIFSKEAEDNFERIFGKKEKPPKLTKEELDDLGALDLPIDMDMWDYE
jgi:hypothetical protein